MSAWSRLPSTRASPPARAPPPAVATTAVAAAAASPAAPVPIADIVDLEVEGSVLQSVSGTMLEGAGEGDVCEGTGVKNEAMLTRGAATSLAAFKGLLPIVLDRAPRINIQD